mgnify:CR=1 FL=1
MKRFVAAALGFAALLTSAMIASADPLKFIYVSHGQANDSFHSVVKNAFMQAGKDLGVDVEYRSPETFDMVAMAVASADQITYLCAAIPEATDSTEALKGFEEVPRANASLHRSGISLLRVEQRGAHSRAARALSVHRHLRPEQNA